MCVCVDGVGECLLLHGGLEEEGTSSDNLVESGLGRGDREEEEEVVVMVVVVENAVSVESLN